MSRWNRLKGPVAMVAIVGVVGFYCVAIVWAAQSAEMKRARVDRKLIEQVNAVCGERPRLAVEDDGTWVVSCPDGSQAVVSREAVKAGVQVAPVGGSR